MASILTPTEAASVLRCDVDDQIMLDLLYPISAFIEGATGWQWSADAEINNNAKSAARMLLVTWYENPSQMGTDETPLAFGLNAVLLQLKAEARRLRELQT